MNDSRVFRLFPLLLVIIFSLFIIQTVQSEQVEEETDYIYLPLVLNPAILLENGGFEMGRSVWNQYSSNGWWLIIEREYLPIDPHNGSWVAWLGGDDDESSIIWQEVTIPNDNPTLVYWMWIDSGDDCGYDIGGVTLDIDNAVDAYWLCSANNTDGWIKRTIDLSAFAGKTMDLEFSAFTDSYLLSNLFIDDVSVGLSSLDVGPDMVTRPETSTQGLAGKSITEVNQDLVGGSIGLGIRFRLLTTIQHAME